MRNNVKFQGKGIPYTTKRSLYLKIQNGKIDLLQFYFKDNTRINNRILFGFAFLQTASKVLICLLIPSSNIQILVTITYPFIPDILTSN